jgi:hypothetical protein
MKIDIRNGKVRVQCIGSCRHDLAGLPGVQYCAFALKEIDPTSTPEAISKVHAGNTKFEIEIQLPSTNGRQKL